MFLAHQIGKYRLLKGGGVGRHSVSALAFTRSHYLLAKRTNKMGSGWVSKFSLHAEELLLRSLVKIKAKERFGYIKVLVLRWSKGKKMWALAKPCKGCSTLLGKYGVDEVHYSNDGGALERLW